MNMHVNFGATDYEQQHRTANVAGSEKLLMLLMWRHPERMTFNPRQLPAPRLNISPFVEGFLSAKHLAERDKPVEEPERTVTISQIRRAVCEYFNTTPTKLNARRRTKEVVYHRSVAVYLSRELTPNSYPVIGRAFGDIDHTSAIACVERIERRMAEFDHIRKDVAVIRHQLEASL